MTVRFVSTQTIAIYTEYLLFFKSVQVDLFADWHFLYWASDTGIPLLDVVRFWSSAEICTQHSRTIYYC